MAIFADLITARDGLLSARLKGVRDSNGEMIGFKSDAELASTLAGADAEIGAIAIGKPARKIIFSTNKGLQSYHGKLSARRLAPDDRPMTCP